MCAVEKDEFQTMVIFRKFGKKEGSTIIALFPEIFASCTNDWDFDSYMHVGQHGASNRQIVHRTKLAKEEEYRDLKEELENSFGYNLVVRSRITPKMDEARKMAYKEFKEIS